MTGWGVWAAIALFTASAPVAEDAPKDKDYQAEITTAPPELASGAAGKLTVTIRPKAPWALKVTTPFEANLTGTAGVELGTNKLTSKDFVDPKSPDKSAVAPFVIKAGGEQSISTALNFFLCTDQVCQRYKETIVTKLIVK